QAGGHPLHGWRIGDVAAADEVDAAVLGHDERAVAGEDGTVGAAACGSERLGPPGFRPHAVQRAVRNAGAHERAVVGTPDRSLTEGHVARHELRTLTHI